jgi:ubiquitin C-terminal hydrolase
LNALIQCLHSIIPPPEHISNWWTTIQHNLTNVNTNPDTIRDLCTTSLAAINSTPPTNAFVKHTQHDPSDLLLHVMNSLKLDQNTTTLIDETTTCPHNCPASSKLDTTQILTLSITNPDPLTPPKNKKSSPRLEDCISWYQNTETYHPNDILECSHCHARSDRWTKTATITSLPKHLILRLTRETTAGPNTTGKNSQPIKFPKHDLRISTPWDDTAPTTFDLQGIIRHHGPTLTSGHYTADILQGPQWLHCDDTQITAMPPPPRPRGRV